MTAVGVRDMGALRGRSLLFLGWGDVDVCAVGLLFCASPSRSLIAKPLSFLSHGAEGGHVCCDPPAILVSGTPSFLGGSDISGSRVEGRSVSVMSGLFEDCSAGRKEEKGHLCARRQCAHLRVAEGWEAKRKMVEMEGPAVRREAMMGDEVASVQGGR